jgi:signal transduction histidine kinase
MEERLDACSDIIYQYIRRAGTKNVQFDSLQSILPAKLRITWINKQGHVYYDNILSPESSLDNHAGRPEILAALEDGTGSDIRISVSDNRKYLYYAKSYGDYYVRVALPYDIQLQSFLRPDYNFIYYILLLFVVGLIFIRHATGRFGGYVKHLRNFLAAADDGALNGEKFPFPDDEMGEIGKKIVSDYLEMKKKEEKIALEKEKLLQHVQISAEGICFFTPEWKVAFHNGLFIQYLNILGDQITINPAHILKEKVFGEVNEFLDEKTGNGYFETHIIKQGRYFLVRVNVFEDGSFEIILNDHTKQEKTRKLKQELTGNIAHELRTPVTSIRGFLETILEQPLEPEKEKDFLQKAYNQVLTLSELIQDMSLLTKIEEAPGSFQLSPVNIAHVIGMIHDDLGHVLKEHAITLLSNVGADVMISGNENLIYSVFRNLTENVIKHAGDGVKIIINGYDQHHDFYYFSFADTGKGMADEKHFQRLFERFYRVTEGRTRDSGGSGLGLSIVKNAIAFHGGTITVKNSVEGGLEFLFRLPKERNDK